MTRRWLLLGTVVVVGTECLLGFVVGWLEWSLRNVMVGAGSMAATENGQLALAIVAVSVVNLIALVVFLVRRWWGWWLLAVIQVADLAITLTEALMRQLPGWWIFSAIAALALLMLAFNQRQTTTG